MIQFIKKNAAIKSRIDFRFPVPVSYICWFVILIFTIPFTGYTLELRLDPSWIYFVNKYNYFLINNPYKFGIDVNFTYGPLGFILFPISTQSTYLIAVFVHLFFGLLCALLLSKIAGQENFKRNKLFVLLFSFLFLFSSNMNIILLMFLLLAVLILKDPFDYFYYLLIALFASCLMFYVKFSLGVLCASILCSLYLLLVLSKKWKIRSKYTLVFLLFYLLVLPAIYLIYSPSLIGLFNLFYYSTEISRGYSAAMSSEGTIFFLPLALMFILTYIIFLIDLYKSGDELYKAGIIFIPALFLSFKGGFVRQDVYHYSDFFNFYLISLAILYISVHKTKAIHTIGGVLVLFSLITGIIYYPGTLLSYMNNAFNASLNRIVNASQEEAEKSLSEAHELSLAELDTNIKQIIGNQAVVIVPHNLTYAYFNHLQLSPMPVIQNYAAFTDKLDSLNADFIEKPSRNQFILFEFEVIDGRNPFTETPLLWQSILRWYEVRYQTDKFLLLERRSEPRNTTLVKIETVYPAKDQEIYIPEKDNQVIAKVSMKYSLIGELSQLFYRIPPIKMRLIRENGEVINVRIIPSTIKNGIFINYFPNNLKEASQLFEMGQLDRTASIQFMGEGSDFISSPMQIDFYDLVNK